MGMLDYLFARGEKSKDIVYNDIRLGSLINIKNNDSYDVDNETGKKKAHQVIGFVRNEYEQKTKLIVSRPLHKRVKTESKITLTVDNNSEIFDDVTFSDEYEYKPNQIEFLLKNVKYSEEIDYILCNKLGINV